MEGIIQGQLNTLKLQETINWSLETVKEADNNRRAVHILHLSAASFPVAVTYFHRRPAKNDNTLIMSLISTPEANSTAAYLFSFKSISLFHMTILLCTRMKRN